MTSSSLLDFLFILFYFGYDKRQLMFGCFCLVVQIVDYDGNTPLIWAARGGHRACVGHLLDYGASTKTPDENGNTALHFSCQVLVVSFQVYS